MDERDEFGAPAPEASGSGHAPPADASAERPPPPQDERAPARRGRGRDVVRTVLIAIAAFAVGFATGFLPQWQKARDLSTELAGVRYDLEISRLQSTLGAALAEVDRGNYERARQLTSVFYVGLDGLQDRVPDAAQSAVIADLSGGRDEVITLLSRAVPEVRSRLAIMYTRYFTAMEPLGRQYGGAMTTSPEDAPGPGAGSSDAAEPEPQPGRSGP